MEIKQPLEPMEPLNGLHLKRLGIDTHQEAVIYMRRDCHVCRAEGLSAHARVYVSVGDKAIIATLNQTTGNLLKPGEVSLSETAWEHLGANEGDAIRVSHARPMDSLGRVRAKVYGQRLSHADFDDIMQDIVEGRYSDIQLSSFITACSARGLDHNEITGLTQAMIAVGKRLDWKTSPVVDKHCIGGLPGNRTTPIIVAIVTACGLMMPKTSSRAITSPAGTADSMETLAPVELDLAAMRRVVEREGGCIVWGGGVNLSPADDIMIRVERALDLDTEGQLVASVLSKKAAAGSTHLILDLPIGHTAKLRSESDADVLETHLLNVAGALGIQARVMRSDGRQPVGRGIGPALEAYDVLAVLQGQTSAPPDLKTRSVALAGALLELAGAADDGHGINLAETTLSSGRAWSKFQAICEAQGGLREPPRSAYTRPVLAERAGQVSSIDNRSLAKTAKLAGAPDDKAAGIELHTPIGQQVEKDEPVFTLHAETRGELAYALTYIDSHPPIVEIESVP